MPHGAGGFDRLPTKWNFEAEYIQSCNCAWGCPCNFDPLPTTGNCEALVSWHIRNGALFEGYILLPGGINMKKSTVTNIRRWSLRDDAAGWNMTHENVAGFVTVQRYNEKGPVKRAG